jgi:hypothetical protein
LPGDEQSQGRLRQAGQDGSQDFGGDGVERELALRDIFGAPSAPAAEGRLKDCEAKLDDYTERVFNALHAT